MIRGEVAIVGAGPAGAWTAHLLARSGARVLLFDPSHPREKPCGGGVTRRALQLVGEAVQGGALPAVAIRSARFGTSTAPRDADVPLREDALWVASRSDFDGLLFEAARHAGARIVSARVTDVRAMPGYFEVTTTTGALYRAATLVGADGANSLVRRRLLRPFRRDQLSMATGFFAHGATSDRITIEFVADPPGYLWSFPRPGHLAIGVCAQADQQVTPAALRTLASDWIVRAGLAPGARLERYAWPIPSLSQADFNSLETAGPRWFLVGDAAGLVDPITREGIYFALLSAAWAADAIAKDSGDSGSRYSARVRSTIGDELGRAARLKRRFFQPAFTRLLIDALRHSASIREVMADLVSGDQGYASLKWRLAKTLHVGLASRLFLGAAARPARAE